MPRTWTGYPLQNKPCVVVTQQKTLLVLTTILTNNYIYASWVILMFYVLLTILFLSLHVFFLICFNFSSVKEDLSRIRTLWIPKEIYQSKGRSQNQIIQFPLMTNKTNYSTLFWWQNKNLNLIKSNWWQSQGRDDYWKYGVFS